MGGVEYFLPREGKTLRLLPWERGKCEHVMLMYKTRKDVQRVNKEQFFTISHAEQPVSTKYVTKLQIKTGSKESAIFIHK